MAYLDPSQFMPNTAPTSNGYLDPSQFMAPSPVATPMATPPVSSNTTAQTATPTSIDPSVIKQMLGSLTNFPKPAPYNPNGPLVPVTSPGFETPNSFSAGNDYTTNAHLANGLTPTIQEKLAYLQKQYPGTKANPNYFGEDINGNVVYSQDGKTWNSFENIKTNPAQWLEGHLGTAVTAPPTAIGGMAGEMLFPTGGEYPGAAIGSMAGQQLLRSIANVKGYTDRQLLNPKEATNAAINGTLAQAGGNIINNVGGAALTGQVVPGLTSDEAASVLGSNASDFTAAGTPGSAMASLRNAGAEIPETGPLSQQEMDILAALGKKPGMQFAPIQNNPLTMPPLARSGFGPLANPSATPLQPLLPGMESPATSVPMSTINQNFAVPLSKWAAIGTQGGAGYLAGLPLGHPGWGAAAGVELPQLLSRLATKDPDAFTNLLAKPLQITLAAVPGSAVYNPGTYITSPIANGSNDQAQALMNLVRNNFGGKKPSK